MPKTRDETLLERMRAGAVTGGALGLGLGGFGALADTPGALMRGDQLRKFLLKHGASAGKLGLTLGLPTALISAGFHGLKGPRKIRVADEE